MASVNICDVRKSYGALEVLHGVSVDIQEGEFVVLVGPSGCGKSTLLRMLAGLEHITKGEVRIADNVVNNLPPKKRNIAMVFQNYALYPHMTVAENMGFSLRLAGASKTDIARQVGQAADALGLTELLARHPKELSGGQRQRVAMGRAIVRDPQVFLFDEPLSNLDAKLRVQMRAEIKTLHRRLETTTVYVTHDQIEAMTMADRIVVMNAGNVEQVGTPMEVYERPANSFVAGFIGSPSMNMFPGTLRDGRPRYAIGDLSRLVDPDSRLSGPVDLQVGVRPEDVRLGGEGLPATVVLIEPTGSATLVTLEIAGLHIHAEVRDRQDLRLGQQTTVSVEPGRAQYFDPVTGARLDPSSVTA